VKLIVIYGAPGVGKLTTARALADLTGFKLFHNHLTFDLVHALFDFPSPPFSDLSEKVRLATFEFAARAKLPGLIFTFVYAAPEDDGFVGRVIEVVEKEQGEIHFVRLHCDAAAHEQRVLAPERKAFGKITSVERLRGAQARWNFTAAVPLRESLEIDNSTLSAALAARRIVERFSLL
jgi:hypothetical protein